MNKYVKEMHEACLEALKECKEIKALVLNLINRDEVKTTIAIEDRKRAEVVQRIELAKMQVPADPMCAAVKSVPLSAVPPLAEGEKTCPKKMTLREMWDIPEDVQQEPEKKQEPINPSSIDVDVSSLLGD